MLKNKNALKMSLQMDKKLKIAYLVLSLTGKLIDLFSYCFLTKSSVKKIFRRYKNI